MDFAFFAVKFGYSKGDYEALTPKEKAFILKEWENDLVFQNTLIYNAVFTAVYNANRPKRKKALKLWRKPNVRSADMETVEENLRLVREVERNEGNSWVKLIYEKNGIRLPEEVKRDGGLYAQCEDHGR